MNYLLRLFLNPGTHVIYDLVVYPKKVILYLYLHFLKYPFGYSIIPPSE
ncbi:MAG: hypothetical protein K0S26_1106 [Bacteroidota bacterium]|nr:hypothetical protein [Bacteroidota bacterium]